MKINKIKSLAFLTLLAFAFAGCEKSTEGISRVTNFPDFVVNGSAKIIHQLGTPYTDAGAIATEAGSEIPVTTTHSGLYRGGNTLDGNTADEYTTTYSATNADGFAGSATRTVCVVNNGDLTTSIEGLYTSTVVRNGSTGPQYTDMGYLMIWKNADGTYQVSDGIGGYYHYGRGYGSNYIAPGLIVTANDISANDFSFSGFSVKSFGGVCETTSMTVDAAAKTVSFTTEWDAGYTFETTLTQVAF
ncbi:MAG: hypothetical protein ACI8ZN_000605 [Bacteroidia bacterium]|jgi:hypothetical protein